MVVYDAVIVGSGASGGAVAYRLSQAGLKVALLEKGRIVKREAFSKDELAYTRREIFTPDPFEEYHIIEERVGEAWVSTPTYTSGRSFWNGNIVGGSSTFMSGMFHRMHPDDFRLKRKYGAIAGANIVDWPISYEELEPYYTLAESLVGITGEGRVHPFSPPRSRTAFAQRATQENGVTRLIEAGCRQLGIRSVVTARAILSEDRGMRHGCYYSNFCGSYGCSSGAKGSAMEAFILPALATGNLTLMSHTHVKRLSMGGASEISGVEVVDTRTHKEQTIQAKQVILAAQAHESVRLLLNSATHAHPDGLANSSGELGKNLIFSAGGSVEGDLCRESLPPKLFAEVMQRGYFVNRSLLEWYFVDDWWDGRFKGGLIEVMFEHQNIISRAVKTIEESGQLLWGEAFGKRVVGRFKDTKRIRLEIFNDWLPTDGCHISVDATHKDIYGMPVGKLRIASHPHDLRVGEYLAKKAKALLKEMGAKRITSSITSTPPPNLIAGGCRFGEDPHHSVLNRYCQSHDIRNLFVVDGSFMPTGGSVPYTWTLYANALRVADYIVKNHTK